MLADVVLPRGHLSIRQVVVLFYRFVSFMVQQPCSIIQRQFPFTDKPEKRRTKILFVAGKTTVVISVLFVITASIY